MSGKIFVIGIGPGNLDYLTERARAVIQLADVVVGYKVYVQLIEELIDQQRVLVSGMKQEMERVTEVVELARTGLNVAIVSSGDAGVYGMAGPIYELLSRVEEEIEVEVIPGVTAILAAAASLGAPLMHDFAVISLSDLLTPWEKIVTRLHLAAKGDFVVGIYNPRSKQRHQHLVEAQKIFLEYRSVDTPVGILWSSTRAEERRLITTLDKIPHEEVNMFATLIIGNSESYISGDVIVTPRGYQR